MLFIKNIDCALYVINEMDLPQLIEHCKQTNYKNIITTMNNTFKALSNTPTPLDEFGKFDIINYSTISDIKAIRLSELRQKTYPERFILEVIEKINQQIKYKAYTFKTLSEALVYQQNLI